MHKNLVERGGGRRSRLGVEALFGILTSRCVNRVCRASLIASPISFWVHVAPKTTSIPWSWRASIAYGLHAEVFFLRRPRLRGRVRSSTPEPASPVVQAEADATLAAATGAAAAPAARDDADPQRFTELPTECAEHQDKIRLPPTKFVKRRALDVPEGDAVVARLPADERRRPGMPPAALSSQRQAGLRRGGLVLLTRREVATGGMRVSGAGGGYEVLRWDGELRFAQGRRAHLEGAAEQGQVREDPDRLLDELFARRSRRTTKSARPSRIVAGVSGRDGRARPKMKAEEAVSGLVVDYLRGGGSIPAPTKLP